MRTRHSGLVAALALIAACSGSGDTAPSSISTAVKPATTPAPTSTLAPASFTVQPGTEQIAVLDANPGDTLTVRRDDAEIAKGTVDEQGSLLFRALEPGDGYVVSSSTEISSEGKPGTK